MHVKVKELPQSLRAALADVGYHCDDIALRAMETYCMSAGASSDGRRAFVCAVNLATGERKTVRGSWGGPNAWNPQNAVDLDETQRPLPPGFAVIHGSEGAQVFASVDLNPATLNPLLPQAPVLTANESAILSMVEGLNSSGRKRQIEDWQRNASQKADPGFADYAARQVAADAVTIAVEATIVSLVGRKLLARNKAGAVSITTEGKNARAAARKVAIASQDRLLSSFDWYPGKDGAQ